MSSKDNGFADMGDYLGKLSQVDPKKVSMKSLEKAANFYMQQLLPNIPKSLFKKNHMGEKVSVVIADDSVKVVFGKTAFYWRFPENGTVNQRAQHFASGTYEQNKATIEKIMTQDIVKLQEG